MLSQVTSDGLVIPNSSLPAGTVFRNLLIVNEMLKWIQH